MDAQKPTVLEMDFWESDDGLTAEELNEVFRCKVRDDCAKTYMLELTIASYRGYKSPQLVSFAHPNAATGSGLTIICGENNTGKSSILSVLAKFWRPAGWVQGDLDRAGYFLDKDEKHASSEARFELRLCNDLTNKFSHTKNKKWAENRHRGNNHSYRLAILTTKSGWIDRGTVEVGDYEHETDRTYADDLFHNIRMQKDYYQGMFDNEFGNFLLAIQHDKGLRGQFNRYLKFLLPSFRRWFVRARNGKYYVTMQATDRQVHGSRLSGDGIQRLFKIVSILCTAHMDIVIDEPELHLHPRVQKRLISLLAEASATRQVIIATHSPYFLRWQDMKNGAKVTHTHWDEKTKENRVVNLNNANPPLNRILKLDKDLYKPYQLDVVAKEIFFSDQLLFVEGQEDVDLLTRLALDSGLRLKFDIFGYGAGGAGNIRKFIALALEMGIKVGALYDGDQQTEYKLAVEEFGQSAMIRILGKDDIRDKINPCTKKVTKVGYFQERESSPKSKKDKAYLIGLLKGFNRYM